MRSKNTSKKHSHQALAEAFNTSRCIHLLILEYRSPRKHCSRQLWWRLFCLLEVERWVCQHKSHTSTVMVSYASSSGKQLRSLCVRISVESVSNTRNVSWCADQHEPTKARWEHAEFGHIGNLISSHHCIPKAKRAICLRPYVFMTQ